MKTNSLFTCAAVLCVLSPGLAACDRAPDPAGNALQEHAQQHLDATYVCTMHPKVSSDQPGRCPICGMDLVAKPRGPVAGGGGKEVLYWRHPHDPGITSDRPMKDEMGMDYVPVYAADGAGAAAGGVSVSSSVRHSLGLRTDPVEYGPLPRTVDAVGSVAWDANRLWHVHARAEGWLEHWNVAAVGDRVRAGQLLFELYSPAMATAEEEYLQAVRMGNAGLVTAAEGKLRALGVPGDSIARLKRERSASGRIPFHAERDGVVVSLAGRHGMYVGPTTEVLVVADLARVWVEAEVIASQGSWLRAGLPATVRLASEPGDAWQGEVTYVYPQVDAASRAQRVRLALDNPDGSLRPGAWASVRIVEADAAPVLHVPREAVIRSGRGDRVIVEEGERFRPRAVTVGHESEGQLAILAGLEPGEKVVTSGQFMLDSEASLAGELDRLEAPAAPPPHGGHQAAAPATNGGAGQ
jgi:Cu(I)/Ag(I) efflux system membrane fusion protein